MTGPGLPLWPDCLNVRDLGGLPAGVGERIRSGALIRSDNLDRLTAEGVAAVGSAGVSRIVDLRTPRECTVYPSPFAADPIRLNRPVNADADEPSDPASPLTEQYIGTLEWNAQRYARAVQAIADAPPGCVVVHCHAGKDRTGMVVALVLSVVGVAPEVVAEDYATVGIPDVLRLVGAGPEAAAAPELELPVAETMLDVLDWVRHRYGDVAGFLTGAGLAADRIPALRARLLTDGR